MYNIDRLIHLHEILYPNWYDDRLRGDTESENIIYNSLIELEGILSSDVDRYTKLKSILKTSSVIMLYQIFYDGNSHTAKLFLVEEMNKIGYSIDYSKVKDLMIIPQIYSYEEDISDNSVDKVSNISVKK